MSFDPIEILLRPQPWTCDKGGGVARNKWAQDNLKTQNEGNIFPHEGGGIPRLLG